MCTRNIEDSWFVTVAAALMLVHVSACGPDGLAKQHPELAQDGRLGLSQQQFAAHLKRLATGYRSAENTPPLYSSSEELMHAWTGALRDALLPFEMANADIPVTAGPLYQTMSVSNSTVGWAQKQRIENIRKYLRGVEKWIRIFKPDIDAIGRVRAEFWSAIYEEAEGIAADVGGDLALDRRLQAPRDVLLALFGRDVAPELDPSLFVWLVGDSLEFLVQRIDGLTPYVDVARLYLGPRDVLASSSSLLGDMWRTLSTLDDPDGLDQIPPLDDWTAVFEAIYSDQGRLIAALAPIAKDAEVGYRKLDILRATAPALPRQYRELAFVLATASERAPRSHNGCASSEAPNRRIKNNLLAVSREALALDLEDKLSRLDEQIASYDGNVDALLRDLISLSGRSLANELLEGERKNAHERLAVLTNTKQEKISRLGSLEQDFQSKISDALLSLQSSSGYLLLQTLNTRNVSAADAQFVPDKKANDAWTTSDLAVLGPFHVPAGGILEVNVPANSSWSPHCAISHDYPLSAAPYTGPEGYAVVEHFGRQLVVSASQGSGMQSGDTGYIASTSVTESANWGNDASFRCGAFSDRVPIHEAPAGSLALISFVGYHTEPMKLVDRALSQVVTAARFNAVAEYDMTYFLVVNDERCEDASAVPLAVSVSRWISATELTKHEVGAVLMEKLGSAVTTIRAQRVSVLQGDELSPERERALRSSISWDIASDPVVGQLADSTAVKQIYDFVVEREFQRLTLQGEVYSLGRQIEQQRAAAYLLQRQIEDAEYAVSLQAMLVNNARSRLHRGVLESAAQESVRVFRDGLASVVDVWYPDLRDTLSLKAVARDVLNAGLHWDLAGMARKTEWILSDAIAAYRTRIRSSTLEQWDKAVMIGIPQPNGSSTDVMAEGPNVSQEAAEAFWSALYSGNDVSMAIGTDLLYAGDAPQHQLVCSDSFPVVHRMALVFVTRHDSEMQALVDTLNGLEITEEVEAPEKQTVIGSDKAVPVEFVDPSRLQFPVGVLFSKIDGEGRKLVHQLASTFPQRLGDRAVGISPYGELAFRFGKLSSWPWRDAQWSPETWLNMYRGAYLVMLVETHEEHREISWLPMCSQ